MASKKAPAKKPAAKKAAKKATAKAGKPAGKTARALALKKGSAKRARDDHFLPPWVVIGKTIQAAIVGVSPEFKSYVVSYFDAPSGWVELGFRRNDGDVVHRTHCNNIVLEATPGN